VLAAIGVSAAGVLVAGAGAKVTESFGVHYAQTGFFSLLARPDGGFFALRQGRLEVFTAAGKAAPGSPSPKLPAATGFFPAAGDKSYALGYQELARLNPDGTLDPSFGDHGVVKPPYGVGAVYELPSGKIALIGGEVTGTHVGVGSVTERLLNQDGSEAKGEGFGISLGESFAPGSGIGIPELSPMSNGGAMVVGDRFLLEIEPDGSLNKAFGKEGVVEAFGLIGGHVLPDGSVEGVGTAPEERGGTGEDLALYRYLPNGEPDTAFGPKGVRRFDFHGAQQEPWTASWGADGSVVVGGSDTLRPCPSENCEEAPLLAAFNPAGELETSFGQGGWLPLTALAGHPQGYGSYGVTALTRRPDGSIVAAGQAPPNRTTGFLAAISAHGALLPGFGEGGIVKVRRPLRASQEIVGLVPQPDGRLLAVGTTDAGLEEHPILTRFKADGRLDRSLGAVTGSVPLGRGQVKGGHGATGFAVAHGDVLTSVYGYPLSHLLMVHADDGSPVASFGGDGAVALPRHIYALKLAFSDGGDPIVLGRKKGVGSAAEEPAVALRYLPDGHLDPSFGKGGKFTMKLGEQPVRGKDLVIGPGDRMVLGGSVGHRFALAGLLPDGKLDRHFGHHGWTVVKLAAPTHHLALARLGSYIYLAGTVGEERGEEELELLRFDRDGRLDRSFGRRGRITAPLHFWAQPNQILPTPRGVLVVLNGGRQPLFTFTRSGKVLRHPAGSRPSFVSDVRAALVGHHLVLGWATYSKRTHSQVLQLARRPLDRP
jgi:uncharacterized delta-60 repeat protein